MEVPVNVVGKRDREAGIAAGRGESFSSKIRVSVVVHNEVDLKTDSAAMQHASKPLESLFGSVQRRPTGPAQIETVIHVIADARVARVRASWRRKPNEAISRQKKIRNAFLDGLIRSIEPLQND